MTVLPCPAPSLGSKLEACTFGTLSWSLAVISGVMLRRVRRCADVPLPEGMQPPSDDQDDKDEAEPRKEPERWSDLGLHAVH